MFTSFLRRAALALLLVALASQQASANLMLTYNSVFLTATPGSSVEVYATLTVPADFGGPLQTNDGGFRLPISTVSDHFLVAQQELLTHFPPPLEFMFVPNPVDPVANLDLAPGSSLDLDLGMIVFPQTAPLGVYIGDIGLYEIVCVTSCTFSPLSSPTFDPGVLTVDLQAVPEPAALWLYCLGLFGLALRKKGRNRAATRWIVRSGAPHHWCC